MVGNNVAVYNGKLFNNVEIKFDMIGRYLGEFSLSYKPCRHGKAGVGATKGSAHSSLK
jgi:small subunit ribosomal protein S15e